MTIKTTVTYKGTVTMEAIDSSAFKVDQCNYAITITGIHKPTIKMAAVPKYTGPCITVKLSEEIDGDFIHLKGVIGQTKIKVKIHGDNCFLSYVGAEGDVHYICFEKVTGLSTMKMWKHQA